MRALLSLLLLLFSITTFGQINSLDRQVNELLQWAKTHQLSNDQIKEVKNHATNIQNRGFTIEEGKSDYVASLTRIDSALNIWHQLNDTWNIANLLKYKGYLLGHLNRFAEAKIKIDPAIYLFKAVRDPSGVAVSQLDLSRIYELESKPDSALKYATLTVPYWKTQKDTFRITTSENQVINLS